MGMGWDDGAPVWPYQTPNILLFTLNTPAYFVANFFRLVENINENGLLIIGDDLEGK